MNLVKIYPKRNKLWNWFNISPTFQDKNWQTIAQHFENFATLAIVTTKKKQLEHFTHASNWIFRRTSGTAIRDEYCGYVLKVVVGGYSTTKRANWLISSSLPNMQKSTSNSKSAKSEDSSGFESCVGSFKFWVVFLDFKNIKNFKNLWETVGCNLKF